MKRILSLTALILCIVMMLSLMPLGASAVEFTEDDRIVIVLDPGHGTQGVSDETNDSEGAYNMRTARYLKAALEANSSFVVYMTNEADDVNLSFYERASKANSYNADLLISVHYNASDSKPELRGMEAYCSVVPRFAMDDLAAMCIEYTMKALPEVVGRGVKHSVDKAGFYWNETYQWDVQGDATGGMLSDHYSIITFGAKFGIPTIILEELYLTSPEDVALATDANIKSMAEAQAQAIIDYYTNHEHDYGKLETDIPVSCVSTGKQSRHCTVCGHRKDVSAIASEPDPDGHFYQPVDINDPKGEWYCVYTRSLKEKAKLDIEEHTGDSLKGIDVPAPVIPPELPSTEAPSDPEPSDTEPPATEPPVTDTPVTDPVDPPEDGGEDEHVHNYRVISGFEVGGGNSPWAKYRCTTCNDTYVMQLSAQYDCEANGHVLMAYSLVDEQYLPNYEPPYIDTEATCEEDGKRYSFCMVCDFSGDDVDQAFGHTKEEVNRVEATCKDEGVIEYSCTVCEKRIAEVIPALGHDMQTAEVVDATVDAEGKKVERCTREGCDAENVVVIPKQDNPDAQTPSEDETMIPVGQQDDSADEDELAEKIDLPLPIIAFIILVILMVAAVIIAPVIIRRRREAAKVVPEAMDFDEEDIGADMKLPTDEEKDEEIMATVIPEIAQVVKTEKEEEKEDAGFSLESIELSVSSEEEPEDTSREDALEALRQSFSESEE